MSVWRAAHCEAAELEHWDSQMRALIQQHERWNGVGGSPQALVGVSMRAATIAVTAPAIFVTDIPAALVGRIFEYIFRAGIEKLQCEEICLPFCT